MSIYYSFSKLISNFNFVQFIFLKSIPKKWGNQKYVTWMLIHVFAMLLHRTIKSFKIINDFFVQVKEPFVEKLSQQVSRPTVLFTPRVAIYPATVVRTHWNMRLRAVAMRLHYEFTADVMRHADGNKFPWKIYNSTLFNRCLYQSTKMQRPVFTWFHFKRNVWTQVFFYRHSQE